MDIERLKNEAKGKLPDYLRGRGNDLRRNIRCIHPENHNNGDKTPSARYNAASNSVYCPVCQKKYDIFNFIEADYGIHDFMGQLKKACNMYGLEMPEPVRQAKKPEPKPEQLQEEPATEAKKEYNFTEAIEAANKAALESNEALAYYAGRGLDSEDIKQYKLGFMPWNIFTKDFVELQRSGWNEFKYIIPYPGGGYIAARNAAATDAGNKYRFPAGLEKRPYYLQREDIDLPTALVEGQFDAIAIHKLGMAAVAIGGNFSEDMLKAWAKENGIKEVIIATDNDKAGRSEAERAENVLKAAGVITEIADTGLLYGDFKDAGAAANDEAQREKLLDGLMDAAEKLQNKKAEIDKIRQRNTGAGVIDAFLETVQSRRYEPIKTGFVPFDELTGGLERQTLVMLAAAPGTGKTTITAQLFEGMAKRGHKVIFINLEMSREQLIARSLSRYAYMEQGEDIKTQDIKRGYEWTESTRRKVLAAAEGYKREIANNFMYYDRGGISADLDTLIDFLDGEAAHEESEGRPAPLVVIDYLHILESSDRNGRNEDTATTLKKCVVRLKAFAMRHNTVVFAISATNRESNKGKTLYLESGRDTSNIEYSADMFLGLNYTSWEKGEDTTIEEEKKRTTKDGRSCRLLTLKLLKNRAGLDAISKEMLLDAEHGAAYAIAK